METTIIITIPSMVTQTEVRDVRKMNYAVENGTKFKRGTRLDCR
jgi:hypothetical protein